MTIQWRTTTVAAVLFAAFVWSPPLAAQSAAKTRTPPPASDAASQARKPPPPPTHAAQPAVPPAQNRPAAKPPAPKSPSPRGPDSRPEAHRRPHVPPTGGTLRYPFVPFYGFDYEYRFPYGLYPRSGYDYPVYPYFPPPGCVTTEVETHGHLRFDILQRNAEVFVDFFYVGIVDDFDGLLDGLNLTPGPHHVELHAEGFEPSAFDVNIEPNRTIVYRTPMRMAAPSATPRT